MSQLIKFICSLITAFVINSNTSSSAQELVQNEIINALNWHYESGFKGNFLYEELPLNINKTCEK